MANNYTPLYNQYLTQTAGYVLPSSVRTYSVFDPASNSWRRMTNDGKSPIPAQGQTVVPVQGMGQGQPVEVHPGYLNPPTQAPAQTPAQMPSGGPRMASGGRLGGDMGASPSQPSASPRGASMSPAEAVAFGVAMQNPGANLQAQPRVFMPLESQYEKFQQEIPRSNAYGPLQNPRVVRNMSPDYQETSAAPVAAAQPTPAAPATPVQTATPVAVQLAPSHKPAVSIYDVIQQEHDNIPERLHQITPGALTGAMVTGLNKTLFPMLRNGFLKFGSGSTVEPLSRVTHAARTATTGSRLTPQAQKVADSLKFTFNH